MYSLTALFQKVKHYENILFQPDILSSKISNFLKSNSIILFGKTLSSNETVAPKSLELLNVMEIL